MADLIFERELNRMFSEAPELGDSNLFALKVDETLQRGWTLRRMLIGGLGIVGGVVGGAQLLGGGLVERLGVATSQSGRLLTGKVIDLVQAGVMPQSLPPDVGMFWVAGLFAVAAVGFAVTRVMREF
jgi:hypothetical protein